MFKRLTGLRCCAIGLAIVSQPVIAAPNVFWTFGFNRHYAHGSGGRAALPSTSLLAAHRSESVKRAVPCRTTAADEPSGESSPPRARDAVAS